MLKKSSKQVKNTSVKTLVVNNVDYISITDIVKQKNALEPKDVVKTGCVLKTH